MEHLVNTCHVCRFNQNSPQQSALHPWEWATSPWQRVHFDFAEHLGKPVLDFTVNGRVSLRGGFVGFVAIALLVFWQIIHLFTSKSEVFRTKATPLHFVIINNKLSHH